MKRKYAALALALSASMALSPVASVSAAATEIGTPPVLSSSQDTDTSAPVAQFSVKGTLQNIENGGHYNFLPSLKFHDDTKLESYILNGKENPTSIKGNTWGDGNYANIKNYLHIGNGEEGKNELTVTDHAGKSSNYTFYLDKTSPSLTEDSIQISPDNGTMAAQKEVTLTVDEAIQSPGEGWVEEAGSNGMVWKKTFTSNYKDEFFTVTDLAGNPSNYIFFEVKRVESRAPEAEVSYSNEQLTNQDVIVTLTTNIECVTPDGWERVNGSKKEFAKVFKENANEEVILISTAGVEATQPVVITVSNIDKVLPTIDDIDYSPDNDQMSTEKTVTITASEAVQYPGDGWTEVEASNGTKWQKTYSEAKKDEVTVTDLAGNVSETLKFEVKRIESEALSAEVSYSNGDGAYTNQDVVATIHTNIECQIPEGWEAVPGSTKRNAFQKTYAENTTETVMLYSLGGQTLSTEINITGIDKEAPSAQISTEGHLQDIVEDTPYGINISLKFYDNQALDHYVLNGIESPTGIQGQWGDGNYQNIHSYLNNGNGEAGKNELVVYDKAGNSKTYSFYIDQTAPNVQLTIEKPDEMTFSKVVTMTGDEPFKVVKNETNTLEFTPYNDDDGDGYATIWTASATQLIENEGYTVEDKIGNTGTVAVNVKNIQKEIGINFWDSVLNKQVCEGTMIIPYDNDVVMPSDISLPKGYQLTGEAPEGINIYDGWIYVEIQKSDVEIGINYWDVENNVQVKEDTFTVSGYTTAINTSSLQIPDGYELANVGDLPIMGGWVQVELRPVEKPQEMKAAVLKIHFIDEFGNPIEGLDPIVLTKNGIVGEYAHFLYENEKTPEIDGDWILPEGYEFASFDDKMIAEQDIMVKYGEILDTLQIAVREV